jgi:hypothetical protein
MKFRVVLSMRHQHADPPFPFGLLRAGRERPRDSRAAEQRDQCAPPDHSITSRTRSRIARCEVRYNREKVLLVEIGYNLGHQRAPFSRAGAVLEVIELPEHVAR